MASTVIELAVNFRSALLHYNECPLWVFIDSNACKAFQCGCEDLVAFLEFSGHCLTASRVFQGLTDLLDAFRQGDRDSWVQDCYAVQQRATTLLMRLDAISRSWNQLRPDPNMTTSQHTVIQDDPASVTNHFSVLKSQQQPAHIPSDSHSHAPKADPASVTPETLSAVVQAAWRQYQTGLARGKFENSPPTDREVYEWVLYQLRLGDQMPGFETWQRYLRKARRLYGCQKNTPRYGRPHGSSIIQLTGM